LAKKGGSRHLNRIAAPKFAAPERKTAVWLAKPMPGRHKLGDSISLRALIRDWLELATDAREAERIIYSGDVLIDGKVAKDSKASIGLMDVISIPKLKKYYVVLMDRKRRLKLSEIDKAKVGTKVCKITGKHTVRGGKIQLTLHDGKTLLTDKSYAMGDSIKLKLPGVEISGSLKREPGSRCFITGGKHAGRTAKLKSLRLGTDALKPQATLEVDGKEIITLTAYLFVVGDEI